MATASRETDIVAKLAQVVTPDATVALAVGTPAGALVPLVRGCSVTGGQNATTNQSAGGETPNPACGRPTNLEAISQVGGSQPGKPQVKLPEFTARASNSAAWARRGGWLL